MIWVMNAGLPIRDNTKFIFWSKFVICKPLLKLGNNFWKSISIVYGLLSDRKKEKKKQNRFEVPITSCNLITTKALKKRFVYREAAHWTLNSLFVVKDVIFIFPERGTKKQIWALDKIQTQTSQIPVGCSWHAYFILPGSAMPRVYRVEFRPPRKSTTLQDGYPE